MSLENTRLLFIDDPLADLASLVSRAQDSQASRLLLLAGKHPVCRIGDQLSPPLTEDKLHFSQTESLARAVLSPAQEEELDKTGSIEIELVLGETHYECSVFFGNGSHNFIVFLPENAR